MNIFIIIISLILSVFNIVSFIFIIKSKTCENFNDNDNFSPLLTITEINNIKKGQKRLIEMMKIFHKICKDNNIKYFLSSGCILGYLRNNKKFLPWDGDIDIVMLKNDFDKFINLNLEELLPKNLHVQSSSKFHNHRFSDELYDSQVNKIFDINTCHYEDSRWPDLIASLDKKYMRGISIDIFICHIEGDKIIRDDWGKKQYNYNDIFPVKEDYFEGINVYIPNNPEKTCEIEIGKDWRNPPDRNYRVPHEGLFSFEPCPINKKLRPDLFK